MSKLQEYSERIAAGNAIARFLPEGTAIRFGYHNGDNGQFNWHQGRLTVDKSEGEARITVEFDSGHEYKGRKYSSFRLDSPKMQSRIGVSVPPQGWDKTEA